jgi:hypothetical protein
MDSEMPVFTKFVFRKDGSTNLVNNKKKQEKENKVKNIPKEQPTRGDKRLKKETAWKIKDAI